MCTVLYPRGIGLCLPTFFPLFRYLWLVLRLRPDFTLVLKPYPHTMAAGLMARIFWKTRLICDVDDLDWAYRKGLAALFLRILQSPWPRHADLVTYHHPLLRNEILDHFQVDDKKLAVLPQGTYLDRLPIKKERINEIKQKLGLEGTKVVGYMAHFNLASDEGAVLKIFTHLRQTHREARLLMIGQGPAWPALRRRLRKEAVGNDVVLAGHVNRQDIQPYLLVCDALLFVIPDRPANRYRCSLKLRDYLASGRPIVSNLRFEASDYAEVLYTSARDDVEAMAEVLGRVLEGHGDGRELQGPKRMRDESWSKIGGHFAESLLGKRFA